MSISYTDSLPGYQDVNIPFGVRYIDSSPGFQDIEIPHLRPVLFWHRQGGQRIPLWARGRMNLAQWRRSLIPGEFFPDETTTGVYDEAILETNATAYNLITTPNTHFENVRFLGRVDVRAANVTFRNCYFEGPPGFRGYDVDSWECLTVTNDAASGVVVEDCTIIPQGTGPNISSTMAKGTSFIRCHIMGGMDAVGVLRYQSGPNMGRADVLVEGCYIHSLCFYTPCPWAADDVTHVDCIQWHGGRGLTVRGCRLEGYDDLTQGNAAVPNPGDYWGPEAWATGGIFGESALSGLRRYSTILMISPGNGTHGELIFEYNWCDHSQAGINSGAASLDFLDPLEIGVNRIENNWFGLDWFLSENNGQGFTVENSFSLLLRQEQEFTIGGNSLWNKGDPFDRSIDNNTRRRG